MTHRPDPSSASAGAHQTWWTPRDPGPGRSHPSQLRIGNAERDQVIADLCKHFSEGRLDEAELEDRTARAAAARTSAELAVLLADLPPLAGPPAAAPTRPPSRHLLARVALVVLLGPFLLTGVVGAGWGLLGVAHAVSHAAFPLFVVAVVLLLSRRRGHRHHHHLP